MAEPDTIDILEQGDLYLGFRPLPGVEDVRTLHDIERFYLVLAPDSGEHPVAFRILVIGRMSAPRPRRAEPRYWGLVTRIAATAANVAQELGPEEYITKSRSRRSRPAAQPCGEGAYCIARHEGHTHFAHALDAAPPAPLARAMGIRTTGNFLICVKNPALTLGDPRYPPEYAEALYPDRLQDRFGPHRYAPVDPPEFLDYEGTQIILLGAEADASRELGAALEPQSEERISSSLIETVRRPLQGREFTHPLEPGHP